ncbi:MAG TPA: maleylpyruvate isomerase N-terminal domain-containing protein [Acidimicrobiia bacterium]|nr:maleylpyruvate isomerase N-terminal domain-containing protein [Acidimicrobiia bacterium]
MGEWQFMDPACRNNLVTAWSREAEQMLDMASSPEVWERPTRSTSWEVRDVIGHLVDTTEGYFESFDVARGKRESRSSVPLREMAKYVNEGAVAFRTISQNDLLARLRDDLDQMNGIASELTDEEWAGLLVPHKYMGPLPAAFYPTFQLVDYGVHSWDIRQGSDEAHALAGDTADLLAPMAFVLWQSTPLIPEDLEPYDIGVRVTGASGGDHRVSVSPSGIGVEPGDVADCSSVLEFDAGSFVLTAFGRINAGTMRGEAESATGFLNSFFRI